jgi:NAD(P)H dehydrogenase (quinone)
MSCGISGSIAVTRVTGKLFWSGSGWRAAAAAKASGKPVQFVCVPVENLCAQFGQAGLPPDVINAVISIQEAFVAGGFDIVTGDIEQLAGRPPRPLSDVLSAAFGA